MNTVTTYSIEFDQDLPSSKYGVVHATGCRDLRDPENVGSDWKTGVADLGTDWAMDIEDGMVKLAPCASKVVPA